MPRLIRDESGDVVVGPNGDMRRDCMAYILRRIETMLKAQEGTDA